MTQKWGFFFFHRKGLRFCSNSALHVNMSFIFQSLLAVVKKGLGKDQWGHFIPSPIRRVQRSPNHPFLREVCSLGRYMLPARELPRLHRKGQEMQWANQTTCKILCDGASLPGFTRKSWVITAESFYRVQSDFASLELPKWRYVLPLSSYEEK